ncbi:MAG TPA: low-specificity L-threonine aldolase [Symbiobacteriaceae bacterium]|nr:low-specificity L-threonine aldolase [Symbiobacteriaceae bacterium]
MTLLMKIIDLRSDTVTVPTPAMRRAMFEAEVGDDVYGEDPTVNQLEVEAAKLLGKEAALFVPTGTQGNQIAVMSHTSRGQEVIMEAESHVFYYEQAGIAVLSGCQTRPIPSVNGAMDPERVEAAIRGVNIHYPVTGLVCVENTHNRSGGCILPMENLAAVAEVAHKHGVPVHMDGARVFNAAVALGRPVAEVVAPVDSVMFCLSKGLAAPVGSMLVGSRAFIDRARRARKLLGGGMRQAGVLAAAGLISIRSMVDRLAEDHENAKTLARGLNEIPGLRVDLATVQTNMIMFDIDDPRWNEESLAGAMTRAGVVCNANGPRRIRLVTHKDVSAADVAEALDRTARVVKVGPDGGAAGHTY